MCLHAALRPPAHGSAQLSKISRDTVHGAASASVRVDKCAGVRGVDDRGVLPAAGGARNQHAVRAARQADCAQARAVRRAQTSTLSRLPAAEHQM